MFREREIILMLCLPVAWLGCSSGTSGWEDSVRWKDYTLFALPTREQFPDEGAVCLLDKGKMEVFGKGQMG
ncbi:MAG: hypothetical protein WBD30_10610, partial [Bacteroidota bacterium]